MNNSKNLLLIFVLVILTCLVVFLLVKSVKTRRPIHKLIIPSKNTENFVGRSTFKPTNDETLKWHFHDKKHPPGHISDENTHNHYIAESANPGETENVLVLSPHKPNYNSNQLCLLTKYCILVNVQPGKFYILSCWVKDIKESSKNLFSLRFASVTGEDYRIDTIGTHVKVTEDDSGKMSVTGWQQRSVIFQVPTKSKDVMTICLLYQPKKGIGSRFITGIELHHYHPNINCYPVQNCLRFFISSLHQSSFNSSGNMIKDLSGVGNSFQCKSDGGTCDFSKGFSLNKTRLIGTCCCDLNTSPLNWSLGFAVKFNSLTCDGFILVRMDTSLENNNSILIIFKKDVVCCSYSQITVKYLSHKKTFNIGYSNYLANYIVNCENGCISVYKDGVLMSFVADDKLTDSGCFNLSNPEIKSYFSNKPFLVNPNKQCVDGVLYNMYLHCRSLTSREITHLYYYFSFIFGNYFDKKVFRCLLSNSCKSPDDKLVQKFPFKPYTEHDIQDATKLDKIKEHKKNMDNKYELDKCKYNEKVCDTKLKHMEVTCEGDAVQHKSIQETQDLLGALVKAFNAKEKDKNKESDCYKTSYHISKGQDENEKYQVYRSVAKKGQ